MNLEQAADRIAPGAGTAITAGNGAAGTAVDLSAHRGKYVSLKFAGKTHVRFAASASLAGAVVVTDMWLAADETQDWKLPEDGSRDFVAGWGIAAAHAGVVVPSSR